MTWTRSLYFIWVALHFRIAYSQSSDAGFLELCNGEYTCLKRLNLIWSLMIGVRVHGSHQIGAGQFNPVTVLGADCQLWLNSSAVTYLYLDLTPCFWNVGSHLKVANSTDKCGRYFTASCKSCSLSEQVVDVINMTCICDQGDNTTRLSTINLSMYLLIYIYIIKANKNRPVS